MTNSIIPYSFIPGTKAKAGEVNANFIALANYIEQNKTYASENIEAIQNSLKTKANKEELINDHTVSTASTDLNDYKTTGTYIFSELFTPLNIPKGTAGILSVAGDEDSVIKQVWYTTDNEMFTRDFKNSEWSDWTSNWGTSSFGATGHYRMPNGLLIQWGHSTAKIVTYPIAYTTFACPLYQKESWHPATERSDTGFGYSNLTGFEGATNGMFSGLYWIAIGY